MTRTRPPPSRRVKRLSLKSGRPPLLSNSRATSISAPLQQRQQQQGQHRSQSHSQSSKHTRSIIRTHHVLQKRLTRARAANDTAQIQALEAQLAEAGGLKTYQLASTVGQSSSRGGDSSRVLVEWLHDEIEPRRRAPRVMAKLDKKQGQQQARKLHAEPGTSSSLPSPNRAASPLPGQLRPSISPQAPPHEHLLLPLHVLEIGALSTQNALNVAGATSVRRIDLRSSGQGIEECDFMAFPLPSAVDGSGEWHGRRGYDVLSLSLVLNYVPDADGRGEMLRRTTQFFAARGDADGEHVEVEAEVAEAGERRRCPRPLLPCLFLVLPAPCLHNSRYLDPRHLTSLMSTLGYSLLNSKTTQKLYYSLWHYDISKQEEWLAQGQPTRFPKKEINPGGGRNNFCIALP
ncbi:uncharacterized protein A1O9_02207 [Exophiala aquamarina CBS 119918]|uniref:25S rRNA adenine-N(1) methyltransferase n=1 Tax=Exophiala aquamarina CBS 119918 TaxID=1182545 RepID=A0A072PL87_9EURO|nr:uncharacterized protein A1O9_02207 [Exophiala aquamarina CBS 119918]KEF60646.1 hypothetical protein A1O9_02207 [Exophiala aquamarina CBS 119918]